MATLFFLSEELGQKFPKLKGQVHAGWQEQYKKPITLDQLLDAPSAKDPNTFSTNETDWLECTMQTLVAEMSEAQREAVGINSEHLKKLHITGHESPEPPAVSQLQPFPLLHLFATNVSFLLQKRARPSAAGAQHNGPSADASVEGRPRRGASSASPASATKVPSP